MVSRLDRAAVALYGPVALALAFADLAIRGNPAYVVNRYIPEVLAGLYEAPFIYRPLAPWLIQTVTSLTGLTPLAGLGLSRFAGLFCSLVTFHLYLRTWHSAGLAVGTTLAMAGLLPLTFTNSWPMPGTYLELTLFNVGCLAIATRRDGLFAFVLLIAALNRETSAFLLMLWIAVRFGELPRRMWLLRGAALGSIWLAVFAGIRWAYGFKGYKVFVLWQNLNYLRAFDPTIEPRLRIFGWFWLALLAVPAALALHGVRLPGLGSVGRWGTILALMFVALCLMTASIVETRVLVPVFPLFAPAAAHFVAMQLGSPSKPTPPA